MLSDADLRRQFYEDSGPEMRANTRRGAWISLLMTFAGYYLDYLLFHGTENEEVLRTIMALRFIGVGLLFFILAVLPRVKSLKFVRVLSHTAALIPMFVLDWMLVAIGTAGSSYYAGHNLIMVGTVLLLQWPLKHAALNALFCVSGYLAVAFALQTPISDLGVAVFFLVCTGVLACLGSYILHNLRFRDYCTGQKLDEKNRQLGEALEELHENEARLLQAEKLSSLGRMSAGIVHEVNNPLNYAVTALHMLRTYSDELPEEERKDYDVSVAEAEVGVGRVIKIVSDLRAFTRGDVQQTGQNVKLAGVMEAARRLVSHDLRGVEFVVDVPEKLEVTGNDNQLCQVFMNFIQNASQAVKAVQDRTDAPRIAVTAREEPGEEILVKIHDKGCGISAEDIENIFDPFFTKRQVGEGMGLGLSICHSILKAHGARVEVESEPDRFTEFVMHFPTLNASREPEADLE